MRTVEAGDLAIGDDHPPRMMGVLNLSPDSPYDPSVFEEPVAAAAYADGLIDEGADIVDIGLESANKRFEVRSADWELSRLELAIETLDHIEREAVLSIETRYAEVAAAALDAGFDMVNDIAGFADPDLPAVCAEREAAVVKMAGPGDIERPGALESVEAIYDALADGLTAQTIVDPAFGGWSEAKTLETDRDTLRRLREFRALDRPILVSINRKNFLKDVVGRDTEEALPASLAATSMAVERGAHVIRTHDVAATRDAARIGYTFGRQRVHTRRLEELDVTTRREVQRHLDQRSSDANPNAAIARVLSLTDLTPDERRRISTLADRAGLLAESSDDRILLAGTGTGLDALSGELDDSLIDIASGIRDAIER